MIRHDFAYADADALISRLRDEVRQVILAILVGEMLSNRIMNLILETIQPLRRAISSMK